MAQSDTKPLVVTEIQPVKVWLPQSMTLAYLAAVVIAILVVLFSGEAQGDFIISYAIGLIYLGCAIWVFTIRRHQHSALAFILFAISMAAILSIPLKMGRSFGFDLLNGIAMGMVGGSILDFTFSFPSIDPVIKQKGYLRWGGYLVAVIGVVVDLFGGGQTLLVGFSGLALLFSLIWMGVRRLRPGMIVEREQARLVLFGAWVGLVPLCFYLIVNLIWLGTFKYSPYWLVPAAIFPVMTAYVVQRYRIVHVDYIVSRAVLYGLLGILVAVGYALLVSGLGLAFDGSFSSVRPLLTGAIIFLLALAINPLRVFMLNKVDSVFFRGQRAYMERVQAFSGELTDLVTMPEILKALHQTIQNSLTPESLHFFVHDSLSDQYVAARVGGDVRSSDLRFSATSPLVHALTGRRSPVFLAELEQSVTHIIQEQARLSLLGASLFAPLRTRNRLAGWCALGLRASGETYTPRDLAFLDSLCDQAALAIERAQVVANMEARIRETTVLGRVAQGVNITISFDDMLELIYAQTVQIVPTDEYHLCLANKESGELIETFYALGDERFGENENKPVSGGRSLELEVLHQRQPILTDDYVQESQRRGILPLRTNQHAWMCVPLHAGAETIGVLSLGRTDVTASYSREQLALLQSISDQAAGAIVKARLLEETERRARQLSTINEVTRQLTSTLELEPLLNNILHSAVDILDCEAGSLLLVDEQTDELVFHVTAGPVAGDFMHRRLPAGTGLVGKAVTSKTPVMVNDVQKSADWFQRPDDETGFTTRALLVVPLLVKEKVTGVIEVINKRSGSSFAQDDLELLSAFAAQAAVAVENVRLFTNTDQALAARVEELSVMQRIDRELNTSLDVGLAMQITLEWAMRQAGTQAGLVGIVQEKGVKIMASQGYTTELETVQDGLLPVVEFNLQEVIDHGNPRRVVLGEQNGEKGLLREALRQVVLPIRRETTTVGILLLETQAQQSISDETLGFLQRLTDHASIAIANAQLYAAVQSANLAKSEFVSFVAHELKNPMTSIKGFTELLAAGAVGPVNEAQANFLQTIRSNIERMNTLVSDLNDLSKIEAGRLRLEFKAFPMPAVVDDAVRSLKRQIDEKGQKLVLALPADLPPVWADRMRVSQVVINLISNAHKYTGQAGEITIGAEACENQWDEAGARQVVHFWVRDTGIGISPEDQKKIFQKFFRADDPKTREVSGTGLGLNITRALVEMQGGKIWFDSVFRQGTTFHFTVPVAEQ